MKIIYYFFILIVQILSLFQFTISKKTRLKITKKKEPNALKFSEINRKCKSECSKLSKVYPCFCDLSCLQYGDCCKLIQKDCENYFEILLNQSISSTKDKNSTDYMEEYFLHKENRSIFNNNRTNNDNVIFNNQTIEKSKLEGKCCNESIAPFNCFCDSQCVINGDCCSDYSYCFKNNFLIEKNEKLSTNKRKLMHNSLYKRKDNIEVPKKHYNTSFGYIKNELYEKLGIIENNQTSYKIIFDNSTKINNDSKKINKLGLSNVNTLTPQIGMKYFNKLDNIGNPKTQIKNYTNDKVESFIKFDKTFMQRAPVEANIYFSKR